MTVRASGAGSFLFCTLLTALLVVASPAAAAEPPSPVPILAVQDATPASSDPQPPVEPQPSPEAATQAHVRPWWGWLLLGRLHPIVVHFPIALLTAAAVVEAWRVCRRRQVPSEAGTYCLAFGVAGAMASVGLGTLNAAHQTVTGDAAIALERHELMGWISMMAAVAALGAGAAARRAGHVRAAAIYVGLLLATGAVVGATGHLGGGLVYGEDYLTGVLPWTRADVAATPSAPDPAPEPTPRPAPRVDAPSAPVMANAPTARHAAPAVVAAQDAAVDFTRDVMPIITDTCVECHGPDKVKARLRMDSVAGLQKGGKSGALLKPGDPDNSLIMRRVLGLDGDDQMPLDKDPLSEKQIDTLRRWIAAGAVYPGAGSQ